MKIKSIYFERPLIGRRYVAVSLSTGSTYKLKKTGGVVVVIPTCREEEKEALKTVYAAAWEWLKGGSPETLDRGAKIACGRLVKLLDWPEQYTTDTETRLHYVVNCMTNNINIF